MGALEPGQTLILGRLQVQRHWTGGVDVFSTEDDECVRLTDEEAAAVARALLFALAPGDPDPLPER